MRECRQCGTPLHTTEKCQCAAKWKLGQYVRIWKNEGYEYGHIETIDPGLKLKTAAGEIEFQQEWTEVMLVGDDGKEIYTTVKQLENAE